MEVTSEKWLQYKAYTLFSCMRPYGAYGPIGLRAKKKGAYGGMQERRTVITEKLCLADKQFLHIRNLRPKIEVPPSTDDADDPEPTDLDMIVGMAKQIASKRPRSSTTYLAIQESMKEKIMQIQGGPRF
ncbi:hypothetical protein NQ317_018135 [Molorchus minor]|uniref:Uncharacterized protein n=1 Tax=Molorchus minor TaxID=1323400 RepID=A0ABQ9IYK5_9CUCU|nr:hypothetical protein NQ317_018135 [Molorchus minor]